MADTGLTKSGIRYPFDFALVNLTLLNPANAMDIKNILVELSYDEDLFSSTCYGYIAVEDSFGFIENFSLSGNEYLRMTFGKADNQNFLIDKLVRVYKIAKRKPEAQGLTETYCLYFCSEEMMLSEQYKILKSYKGMAVSDIVEDIITNYLKVDSSNRISGDLEQTKGTYDFIIPNLKPFDAINWILTYARPSDPNVGADLLFYEDQNGLKLRSLQTLQKQVPYKTYYYDPKNVLSFDTSKANINFDLSNALTYEIMDSFDTLEAINSGMLANSVLNVDILLRRAFLQKFDYEKDLYNKIGTAGTLNNYPPFNYNFQNRLGDTPNTTHLANFKLVFGNSREMESNMISSNPTAVARDIFAEVYIPYRTAQLPLSTYMRTKISVPGDPLLTVGKVINFNLLSKDPNNKIPDPFYSGNYLITSVKHLIAKLEYRTVLELTKDSNSSTYRQIDNASTIWQNSVAGIFKGKNG
jgi:hypothetical protein